MPCTWCLLRSLTLELACVVRRRPSCRPRLRLTSSKGSCRATCASRLVQPQAAQVTHFRCRLQRVVPQLVVLVTHSRLVCNALQSTQWSSLRAWHMRPAQVGGLLTCSAGVARGGRGAA